MKRRTEQGSDGGAQTTSSSGRCAIAVIYTDKPSRERALGICDSLAGHLQKDLQLEFSWWHTKFLRDSQLARLASAAAADSDVIIFSTNGSEPLAPEVKHWLEDGIGKGGERAFAACLPRDRNADKNTLESYLRGVARHAEMDYLPLDDEPRGQSMPPSRWGINE